MTVFSQWIKPGARCGSSLWQVAPVAGGAFANSPFPYPNPEQLVAHEQFWQTHFRLDFQADTLITDGAALRVPENTHYVFIKKIPIRFG